jgi:hypothetical protein
MAVDYNSKKFYAIGPRLHHNTDLDKDLDTDLAADLATDLAADLATGLAADLAAHLDID